LALIFGSWDGIAVLCYLAFYLLNIQGQIVDNVRRLIDELGPGRLMFGPDWPFFAIATLLARLLIATEGDNTVRKMSYSENAALFLGLD